MSKKFTVQLLDTTVQPALPGFVFGKLVLKSAAYLELRDVRKQAKQWFDDLLQQKCSAVVRNQLTNRVSYIPRYSFETINNKEYVKLPLCFVFNNRLAYTKLVDLRQQVKKMPPRICVKPDFNLHDYQQQVVSHALAELAKPNCHATCLIQPCGAGKTVQFGAIVGSLAVRTFVAVPSTDAAKQTKKEFELVLNVLPTDIVCIGSEFGAVHLDAWIYVCVFNSAMSTDSVTTKYASIIASSDLLVVDECHGFPARFVSSITKNFHGKYRLGVTATPERKDNTAALIFDHLGPASSVLTRIMPPLGLWKFTMLDYCNPEHASILFINDYAKKKVKSHTKMIARICKDETRCQLLGQFMLDNLPGDTLVLADHSSLVDYLVDWLNQKCENCAFAYHGQNSSKLAQQAKSDAFMNARYIIATTAKAGQALNIARLKYLVFATPRTPDRHLVQGAGRILRQDHQTHTYYVNDVSTASFVRKAEQCLQWFQQSGYQIMERVGLNTGKAGQPGRTAQTAQTDHLITEPDMPDLPSKPTWLDKFVANKRTYATNTTKTTKTTKTTSTTKLC
jgi:hypothetical protein